MTKNETLTLRITGATAEGFGVGHAEGLAVFVPLTAEGDLALVRVVKVKKQYAYGKLLELLQSAPDRQAADCDCFSQCGGCAWRHISYEAECRLKRRRVADALGRIGGFSLEPEPILGAVRTERYRNKAQYPVSAGGQFGFYALHSHRVVPCGDCRLQPAVFSKIVAAVSAWMRTYSIPPYDAACHAGVLRHLYIRSAEATGEVMVVLVCNAEALPESGPLIAALRQAAGEGLKSVVLNVNRARTNVILGREVRVLYGQGFITDILCGLSIRLSPLSFYQVNREMAERLYCKAAEYAEPTGRQVLDLYCGAGTIGLSMAREAAFVTGVEIVAEAVADARRNAAENGIENARFLCADAAEAAKQLAGEGYRADVVLLDPPRKGCEGAVLRIVAESFAPARIVYVSCDPATLSRDAARLEGFGYRLCEVTPVDLFPRTSHVECVALLQRN